MSFFALLKARSHSQDVTGQANIPRAQHCNIRCSHVYIGDCRLGRGRRIQGRHSCDVQEWRQTGVAKLLLYLGDGELRVVRPPVLHPQSLEDWSIGQFTRWFSTRPIDVKQSCYGSLKLRENVAVVCNVSLADSLCKQASPDRFSTLSEAVWTQRVQRQVGGSDYRPKNLLSQWHNKSRFPELVHT